MERESENGPKWVFLMLGVILEEKVKKNGECEEIYQEFWKSVESDSFNERLDDFSREFKNGLKGLSFESNFEMEFERNPETRQRILLFNEKIRNSLEEERQGMMIILLLKFK